MFRRGVGGAGGFRLESCAAVGLWLADVEMGVYG